MQSLFNVYKKWKFTFNIHLPNYCSSNPEVPNSRLQGSSKVNSSFHPSEIDLMSTRNCWGLSGKK